MVPEDEELLLEDELELLDEELLDEDELDEELVVDEALPDDDELLDATGGALPGPPPQLQRANNNAPTKAHLNRCIKTPGRSSKVIWRRATLPHRRGAQCNGNLSLPRCLAFKSRKACRLIAKGTNAGFTLLIAQISSILYKNSWCEFMRTDLNEPKNLFYTTGAWI